MIQGEALNMSVDPDSTGSQAKSQRIVSVDYFRGISIFLMLVYNYVPFFSIDVPAIFQHNKLSRLMFGDLVAPFFLFILGVSMALSIKKRREKGVSEIEIFHQVLTRSFLLIIIGLVLDVSLGYILGNSPHYIWGVLETLGASYLVAYLVIRFSMLGQVATIGVLLGIHLGLSTIPGYVDILRWVSHGSPFSVLAWAPITIFGLICGERLVKDRQDYELFLFRVGVPLIGLAILVSLIEPINKVLVTSGYSLFSAGASALFFMVVYFLTETKKLVIFNRLMQPFRELGVNALLAWVIQYIIAAPFIYYFYKNGKLATTYGILLAASIILITWSLIYVANRKGIRLKV